MEREFHVHIRQNPFTKYNMFFPEVNAHFISIQAKKSLEGILFELNPNILRVEGNPRTRHKKSNIKRNLKPNDLIVALANENLSQFKYRINKSNDPPNNDLTPLIHREIMYLDPGRHTWMKLSNSK